MCLLLPFSSFTPDEWEGYSAENIAKAERERKASIALRSEINGILMQSYVDLRNIFEVVNNEFSKRIEESVTAKRSLEKELARVSLDNNSVHRIWRGTSVKSGYSGSNWKLEAGKIFEEIWKQSRIKNSKQFQPKKKA